MVSKNTTPEGLYSLQELAGCLGISIKSVSNKLSAKGFRKIKSLNGLSLYSKAHLEALQVRKQRPSIVGDFHTYKSKMNNL